MREGGSEGGMEGRREINKEGMREGVTGAKPGNQLVYNKAHSLSQRSLVLFSQHIIQRKYCFHTKHLLV